MHPIMESLDFQYGRDILHSIQTIIDGAGLYSDDLTEELSRFETHFVTGKTAPQEETEQSRVLDLSEPPPECLELNSLANQISAVMKTPLTPARIYNCLADELAEVHVDTAAPENILANLKTLEEKGNEE